MDDWRTILNHLAPRHDSHEAFYPERVDTEGPVLLNEDGPLAAALVAARVLRAIANRRGTRIAPAHLERLERLVSRGLADEVVPHCHAEAERILRWIADPPETSPEAGRPSKTPELDAMLATDLHSRLSVANFALDEGFDLELEYFDRDSQRWPRLRAALLDVEAADAADIHTSLVLRNGSQDLTVALHFVRWLMPIAPLERDESSPPAGGDILPFPGPSNGG